MFSLACLLCPDKVSVTACPRVCVRACVNAHTRFSRIFLPRAHRALSSRGPSYCTLSEEVVGSSSPMNAAGASGEFRRDATAALQYVGRAFRCVGRRTLPFPGEPVAQPLLRCALYVGLRRCAVGPSLVYSYFYWS